MEYTDLNKGLSEQQAAQKKADGLSNGSFDVKTKSVGAIIRDNTLTLFNLINVILAVLIASVGSWRNMLFMGVVISNTAIGIIQEIRSKRVIDKLSLISAPKARLLRDGEEKEYPVSEIVLGDVMLLAAGQQVCADAVILDGECETDESLITGEADAIAKKTGDELLSGSYVVSGNVKAQAVRVGAESYSNRITSSAKTLRKNSSEMMKSINKIIKVISCCIFPFGAVLLFKAIAITQQTYERGIVSTCAALIGMIPEGLVLLTSIALAVSTIRLAKQRTLCQDLYCVEALARVDVLCLDKTGTITEGAMEVGEIIPLDSAFDYDSAMNAFSAFSEDGNATMRAIKARFTKGTDLTKTAAVPFSSQRKWSAVSFGEKGTFVLGAAEFILGERLNEDIRARIKEQSEKGFRVLLLAYSKAEITGKELPAAISPKALITLSDKIRDTAHSTLEFFKEQGVEIKIISGDDPITVSQTALRAGVSGAPNFVDASLLNDSTIEEAAEKYTVFGRVTPERKKQLVLALQKKGHKVAMTGDGVNDVPALRAADCSVAMQSGSDAARSVSQLVLLDSNLENMPQVVKEGRRTINNIQRSASLFLVKTIFSFLLAALFLVIPLPYPFQPIQLTLISALAIGVPSFLLALEPNGDRVCGSFIQNVLRRAAPGGVSAVIGVVLVIIAGEFLQLSQEAVSAMATFVLASVCFAVLFTVCKPFNLRRAGLWVVLAAAFVAAAVLFADVFYLVSPGTLGWVAVGAIIGIVLLIFAGLFNAAEKVAARKTK